MNKQSVLKVVFTGRDLAFDSPFTIVKVGTYDLTPEGCILALRDGVFDKYNKQAPEYTCIAFHKIKNNTTDGKEITVYMFVCVEYEGDGKTVANIITGKATYSRFV